MIFTFCVKLQQLFLQGLVAVFFCYLVLFPHILMCEENMRKNIYKYASGFKFRCTVSSEKITQFTTGLIYTNIQYCGRLKKSISYFNQLNMGSC